MATLFILLWLTSLAAIVYGLIKPQKMIFWDKGKGRTTVLKYYGSLSALLFIGAIIATPTPPKDEKALLNPVLSSENAPEHNIASSTKALAVVPASTEKTTTATSTNPVTVNEPVASTDLFLVTQVIDGDTIEIETGERVRYIGIDTPETKDPRKPVQCYGAEASAKNKQLVLNKKVKLVKDVSDKDKYGRLLRYVYVNDTFVNLELVRTGYAKVYTYPPDVKYNQLLLEAQKAAQNAKLGLWSACTDGTTTPTTNTQTAPAEAVSPIAPSEVPSQPVVQPITGQCSIKGNISSKDEKIYHLPGCGSYAKTVINEAEGERWFCTEAEAQNAGWRKAGNC